MFFSITVSGIEITSLTISVFFRSTRSAESCTHSNSFPSMSNNPRSFGSRLPHDQACSLLLA